MLADVHSDPPSHTVRLCDRRATPRPLVLLDQSQFRKIVLKPLFTMTWASSRFLYESLISIDGQLMDTMSMLMTDERQGDSPIDTSATARWIGTEWINLGIRQDDIVSRNIRLSCVRRDTLVVSSPLCENAFENPLNVTLIHLWHPACECKKASCCGRTEFLYCVVYPVLEHD